ncbi:hypothetical protein ABZT26_36205 [Streptomyces sp. NPDC005395]|uniref:hypothetical protein n=1 Tax=Streptomyces sp. NPDC005395 TaxID=3157042 RepID=UPI0033B8520D
MQTEAIAALAASGAAVLGVPAALVVGFRQARVANHAAVLAAVTVHDQSRKTARRDAAVAFVLAVEAAVDECSHMITTVRPVESRQEEMNRRVLGDAKRAFAVIRLEGPEDIAQKAETALNDLIQLSFRTGRQQRAAYSLATVIETTGYNSTVSAAFDELTRASDAEEDRARVREAWDTIAGEDIPLTEAALIMLKSDVRIGASGDRPVAKQFGFAGARVTVRHALTAFIHATREHLDARAAP